MKLEPFSPSALPAFLNGFVQKYPAAKSAVTRVHQFARDVLCGTAYGVVGVQVLTALSISEAIFSLCPKQKQDMGLNVSKTPPESDHGKMDIALKGAWLTLASIPGVYIASVLPSACIPLTTMMMRFRFEDLSETKKLAFLLSSAIVAEGVTLAILGSEKTLELAKLGAIGGAITNLAISAFFAKPKKHLPHFA